MPARRPGRASAAVKAAAVGRDAGAGGRLSPRLDWYEDTPHYDLGAVLEAAVRAPGLRTLHVSAATADLRHSHALGRAAASSRLRVLEIQDPILRLHDITALAMIPGLQQLLVLVDYHAADDPALLALVAQYAAGGLHIKPMADPSETEVVTHDYEGW